MESRHKVVGIDVGFGFTKYMWLAAGERATDLFPSLVAPEPTSELPGFDLVSTGPRSATAKITVIVGKGAKSRRFVVGKSVVNELPTDHAHRTLNSHYAGSDDYSALLRGAITAIGATQIDHLVLGLPLTTFATKAATLQERFAGKHEHLVPLAGGTQYVCHVGKVTVLPQPVAAFLYHSANNKPDGEAANRSGLTLVIDIGYLTLDWVVTDGRQPIASRSSASNNGMSTICDAVCKSLATELDLEFSFGLRKEVEQAIGRRTFTIAIRGKATNFEKHARPGEAMAEANLDALVKRSVTTLADISRVVITGGGAQFYAPVATKYFGDIVSTSADAQYDIVRGLYTFGELLQNRKG